MYVLVLYSLIDDQPLMERPVKAAFAGTCWVSGGSPFESPAKSIEAAAMARQADAFGGMFSVRGPLPADRAARHASKRVDLELTPRRVSWP